MLQAERVALNFVQRLSGIATLTAQYVAAAAGTKARIVDTRKTTPGLRVVERYAVRCGRRVEPPLFAVGCGAGRRTITWRCWRERQDLTAALRAARTQLAAYGDACGDRGRQTADQIEAVLAAGVDTIMLDNFSLEDLRAGVSQVAGRALVEASGGVTRWNGCAEVAATGVDLISVGALTHSVGSLDLGLDISTG